MNVEIVDLKCLLDCSKVTSFYHPSMNPDLLAGIDIEQREAADVEP